MIEPKKADYYLYQSGNISIDTSKSLLTYARKELERLISTDKWNRQFVVRMFLSLRLNDQ